MCGLRTGISRNDRPSRLSCEGAAQAAELGQWGLARALFEHGLRGSPRHTPLAERLAEVLLQLGDYQAAAAVVAHLLRLDACHPRARQLAAFLAAHGAELPEAARRCLPGACPGLLAVSWDACVSAISCTPTRKHNLCTADRSCHAPGFCHTLRPSLKRKDA